MCCALSSLILSFSILCVTYMLLNETIFHNFIHIMYGLVHLSLRSGGAVHCYNAMPSRARSTGGSHILTISSMLSNNAGVTSSLQLRPSLFIPPGCWSSPEAMKSYFDPTAASEIDVTMDEGRCKPTEASHW